ncbi:MAG: dihydrolipoyllysine-residue succinyltransferase [Bacteroidetes bacterium]|nr:MAG: dihydrolipoyllysine-residue succinyltransferase [Bacteroidota bacterium]
MSVIEMKVPTVGESISEVTIANWLKKDGDVVKLDEIICELESDKATFELAAEKAGTLTIVGKSGDTLAIGALICKIDTSGAASVSATVATPAKEETATFSPAVSKTDSSNYASGTPSPAAAKILAEKGVDATSVKGTGVDGRITKDDAQQAQKAAPAVAATTFSTTTTSGARDQRREKMSPLRKTVARRLVAVKNETAMLTTFNEVDMKPIMDLRSKYKDMFKEKHGIGLGFMSFFTKACTVALKEFPAVNAFIDGEELVYNDFCDISIAVSAPKGLVVPIIRNDQMTGGTFTITNGGVFGSMLSTPIINAPQSAILGMHNIVERPMAVNGEVVIRPIMYVALSYDHRIIDGRESVGFLVRVKQLLEDPARLLLQV